MKVYELSGPKGEMLAKSTTPLKHSRELFASLIFPKGELLCGTYLAFTPLIIHEWVLILPNSLILILCQQN